MSEVDASPRSRKIVLIPLVLFMVLSALMLVRLFTGDPQKLPSALIGQLAPATPLPPLEGLTLPGINPEDLKGGITLVNVFASWCIPCHDEHPQLLELAKDSRIRLYGLNYKDQSENARRFIGRYGNPYQRIGVDPNGRAGIEWGVYGVPETFILGRDGRILFKFVGPIMPEQLDKVIRPQIAQAFGN